jgi:hypothetical protein
MAIAIGSLKTNVAGNQRVSSATLTGDSSYTTGGYSVSAASLGLATINSVAITENAGGFLPQSSLNAAGTILNVKFFNTETGGAAGPGTEVVATTNVSTGVFNVVAFGY